MLEFVFLGGVLLGCLVGLVNLLWIKGNYNVMYLGIDVVEVVYVVIKDGCLGDMLDIYGIVLCNGLVGKDLIKVCNVVLLNGKFGFLGGLLIGGFDMWF